MKYILPDGRLIEATYAEVEQLLHRYVRPAIKYRKPQQRRRVVEVEFRKIEFAPQLDSSQVSRIRLPGTLVLDADSHDYKVEVNRIDRMRKMENEDLILLMS